MKYHRLKATLTYGSVNKPRLKYVKAREALLWYDVPNIVLSYF